MAAINHKNREAKRREEQVQLEKTGMNQYYGIGAIIALGVIGGLGYYIYRSKKGEAPNNLPQQPCPQAIAAQPQTNKFEMD